MNEYSWTRIKLDLTNLFNHFALHFCGNDSQKSNSPTTSSSQSVF